MDNTVFDRYAALQAEREAAKPYLLEYVQSITERSPRAGKNHFNCPLCGSGNGPHGSGAFSVTDDLLHFTCFSCSRSGDVIDLIKAVENIAEERDALERLAGLFPGIRSGATPASFRPEPAKPEKPNTPGLYTAYLNACAEKAAQTNYFTLRGFTPETVARFRLGYDPERDIITMPYAINDCYYMARPTTGKAFYKPPASEAGPEPVFNAAALYGGKPCFICEAPIDAMSIEQAGGNACATGGTAFTNLLKQIKRKRPAAPVIICYDNDKPDPKTGRRPGPEAAERLAAELAALKVHFINGTPLFAMNTYPHGESLKDPNDLLRADPVRFAADVARITERAKSATSAPDPFTPSGLPADPIGNQDAAGASDPEPVTAPECLPLAPKVYRASDYLFTGEYDAELSYFSAYKDRKTGFINVDKYFTVYPGLAVLGGAASVGKTSFCVNLAENLAERSETVLYFALEQEPVELITKLIARHLYEVNPATQYTNNDVKNGVKAPEIDAAREAAGGSAADNLYIINEDFLTTVETVKDTVKAFIVRTGKKPIVIIDYLQLLSPSPLDPSKDTRGQTDYNLKALKSLQRDNELFILLISNFNRSSYKDPVTYEAFKESGLIEYTCDYVFGLQLSILNDPNYWSLPPGPRGGSKPTTAEQKEQMLTRARQEIPKSVTLVSLKNRNGRQSWNAFFRYYPQFDCFVPDLANKYDKTVIAAPATVPTAAAVFGPAADPSGASGGSDPEIAAETAEALAAAKAKKKTTKGTKKA